MVNQTKVNKCILFFCIFNEDNNTNLLAYSSTPIPEQPEAPARVDYHINGTEAMIESPKVQPPPLTPRTCWKRAGSFTELAAAATGNCALYPSSYHS